MIWFDNLKTTVILGPLNQSLKVKVECESCQYMIGYLDGMVKRKSSTQAIEQAVNRVCGYMLFMDKEQVRVYPTVTSCILLMEMVFRVEFMQ